MQVVSVGMTVCDAHDIDIILFSPPSLASGVYFPSFVVTEFGTDPHPFVNNNLGDKEGYSFSYRIHHPHLMHENDLSPNFNYNFIMVWLFLLTFPTVFQMYPHDCFTEQDMQGLQYSYNFDLIWWVFICFEIALSPRQTWSRDEQVDQIIWHRHKT